MSLVFREKNENSLPGTFLIENFIKIPYAMLKPFYHVSTFILTKSYLVIKCSIKACVPLGDIFWR